MTTIATLFTEAYNAGRIVQEKEHNREEIDGRQIWNELESKTGILKDTNLLNQENENLLYEPTLTKLYIEMDKLFVKHKMSENEMNPISNHFFCQLKNLVVKKSNYNIQLNRVMQLGYNAGQLSIFIERGTLPDDRKKEITQFVREYNMLDLNTYVSLENQEIINTKYLPSIQMGGGDIYYLKYLKYKSKYMQLKRKKLF